MTLQVPRFKKVVSAKRRALKEVEPVVMPMPSMPSEWQSFLRC